MPKETLITNARSKRGFGIDTTQTAIGRLPAHDDTDGQSLALSKNEYQLISTLLTNACQTTATGPITVSTPVKNGSINHKMIVRNTRDLSDADDLDAIREFEIDVLCETTHHTRMTIRLQKDRNGNYWINLRANPSSLINGHNAFGVAIEGVSARDELGRVLRLPFRLLQRLLQAVDRDFMWEKKTAKRIRKLLFKACPIQVFTYMNPSPFSAPRLLGFLRFVLSCPLGNGHGGYSLLGDLLEIQIDARLVGGLSVQSLLLKIHRGGAPAVSVNCYDKEAAVTAEAAARKVDLGDDEVRQFLRKHLRVDVTLHDPALRDLQAEAGVASKGRAVLTAAAFRRAVRALDRGKGKSGRGFEQWLLHYIFDECLPLLRLLNYRPSLLGEVRRKLVSGNAEAVKLFDEWLERGFAFDSERGPLSFEQFAQHFAKNRVNRQTARTMRAKVRAAGLDLDLPLAAYNAVFNIRHVIDLDQGDQHALAVAFERGDHEALLRLTGKSKENSGRTITNLSGAFSKMIASAHVPAVLLGAGDDDQQDELPVAGKLIPARSSGGQKVR